MGPELCSLRARLDARQLHVQFNSSDPLLGAARAAFENRFLNEVDPDGVLPESERHRRAEHAKKATS
jgi:hypothetical protein